MTHRNLSLWVAGCGSHNKWFACAQEKHQTHRRTYSQMGGWDRQAIPTESSTQPKMLTGAQQGSLAGKPGSKGVA